MVDPSTKQARHALHSVLEDVIGRDKPDTPMTHLPPHPADEVATKAVHCRLREALRAVKVDLEARFHSLEGHFDGLEERFDRFDETVMELQKFYVGVTAGSMIGLTAIFSLVVAFRR